MTHVGFASHQGDDFAKSGDREHELKMLTSGKFRETLDEMKIRLSCFPQISKLLDCHQRSQVKEESDETSSEGPLEVNQQGQGHLMILSSMTPATGNCTTARRLQSIASSLGWRSICCDVGDFEDSSALRAFVDEHAITAVLGVHAYRAGKLLLEQDCPYGIVLGGTDVNVMANDPLKLPIMQTALERALCIVSFSHAMRDKTRRWATTQAPTIIMPQAAAAPAPVPFTLPASVKLTDEDRVFLLPCGLRDVKDPSYLVQAFKRWHRLNPHVWLIIVGPSLDKCCYDSLRLAITGQEEKIEGGERKEQLLEQDGVLYLPPLPHPELIGLMHASFAVVNSSKAEGMCGSLLEAMLIGRLVLARAVPGNLELVRHRLTGFLFSSPDEFVRLAKEALEDEEKVHSIVTSARRYVEAHHSQREERRAMKTTLNILKKTC